MPRTSTTFQKGKPPGPGRPKGSKDVPLAEAKEIIHQVFQGLGGYDEMLAWAKKNKSAFYLHLFTRLLPLKVDGVIQHNVVVDDARERLAYLIDSLAAAQEKDEIVIEADAEPDGRTPPRLVVLGSS